MALPTRYTSGYTYYYTYGDHPNVACVCLKEWLTWFRKLCVAKGYTDPVVWQCTGGDPNSGGTHTRGGAFDLGGVGNARAMLAREMGAVAWPRDWSGNRHTHGIIDCPHNDPAVYQRTACMVYRRDGLGYKGLAGPDPLPKPSRWRTRSEGILWAKAEIARITGQQILNTVTEADDMFSDADREKLAYVSTQVKVVAQDSSDRDRDLARAIAALADAVQALPAEVWRTTVLRNGENVPVIQEVADAHSQARRAAELAARLASQ